MRSRLAFSGLALAASIGAIALPAASAQAATVVPLPPLSYVHQVLVDDAAGYVFISEGYYSSSLQTSGGGIVVTNLAGSYVTTVDAGDAVEGMALSGGTLYAALDANGAVAAIDVSTITQQAPTQTLYSLGSGYLPYGLALQSGELWVSYGNASGGFGAIGEISLTSSSPAFVPAVLTGPSWYYAPDLAADPANTGYLAAAVSDLVPATMATYDVANGNNAPLAQTNNPSTFDDCPSGELGLTVARGGATIGVICDGFPNALAFTTDSLAPDGNYGNFSNGVLASAVAVAPDGTIAEAASGGANPGTSEIGTFTASGQPLNLYQSAASPSVMTNGLAWSQDSSTLYAVLVTYSTTAPPTATYSLEVIDNAGTPPPVLTLTGPSSAAYSSPVGLSGTVSVGGAAPSAGSTVTITRTATGQASKTFTAATTAVGGFTVSDRTDPVPGEYTYTASYDGMTSPGASLTVTITQAHPAVAARLRGYYASVRHGSLLYRLYRRRARITVVVRVTPARRGDCVRLQVQEYYRHAWRNRFTTFCAALNRANRVVSSIAARREALHARYRLRAIFVPRGDPTVTRARSGWLHFQVER